ncbi:MAG: hypothetical protein OXM02_13080 [Bacteroidota bacterium]|nr:hypothetical protein [Bacteroidota bacterium]
MGSSAVFVAICIDALISGGPALMATLVLATGLFQRLLSERLLLFRQILTPTVSATVLMLTPVSVLQPIFQMLEDVPANSLPFAAPVTAIVTLAVICSLILLGTGGIRLWAPVMGVGAGAIAAALVGLYDTSGIAAASWMGLPDHRWPGLDLAFGGAFWALLPGFLLAAMIGSIRTISSASAVQRISWHTSRAVNYRAVQGAVATDGLSNAFAGIIGTVPNTAYSLGASVAQLTGVASRQVGITASLMTLMLAFLPKTIALILAIPMPVFGAYLVVMMSILFMIGIRMLQHGGGLNYRRMVIVGVSFWIGLGFQIRLIFPDFFADFAGGLLNNGMTSGGLIAILLTLIVKLPESRPRHLSMALDSSGLDQLRVFLADFARSSGWDQAMSDRLAAVSEEYRSRSLSVRRRPDTAGEEG